MRDVKDIEHGFKVSDLSNDLGRASNWQAWIKNMPRLDFPEDYLIRIIPPFAGAIIRFCVSLRANPENEVSVFLDAWGCLSAVMDNPYWEICPSYGTITERFDFKDHEQMLNTIDKVLRNYEQADSNWE